MVWTVMAAAAAMAAAVLSGLCLWALRRDGGQGRGPEEPNGEKDDGEDAELREGILNLMRYAPAGKEKEE